jgi:MFS family permease
LRFHYFDKIVNHTAMKTSLPPRKTITLLGLGTAVSLLGESTLYTVLPNPSVAAEIGITITMVGILLGTNRAVRLITNGPVGFLYEKFPRRPMLILSLALGAISSILYTLGAGFWPLFIGRVSWGIAWSLLWIGCKTVVQEISNNENRGHLNGRYNMFYLLGSGLASLIGAILSDLVGFYNGQRISAVLILVAAIFWYFFLPETREAEIDLQDVRTKPLSIEPLPWKIMIPAAFIIFTARFIDRGLLAATVPLWINSLFGNGLTIFSFLIPIATLTGIYNAVKILPSIGSAPALGALSDRLGKRWIVVAGALSIGALGMWLMSLPLIILAWIGALITPVIGAGVETLVPALIGDHTSRNNNGRALGIIYIFADLGSTLGPMIGLGLLDASIISLQGLYRACAFFIIIAVAIALLTSQRKTKVKPV